MLKPAKDNIFPMESSTTKYGHQTHHHFHALCKQCVGQHIEVETTHGAVYRGQLHSYDKDNMYLMMHMHGRDDDSRLVFVGPGVFPGFGLFGFPFHRVRRFRPFWW